MELDTFPHVCVDVQAFFEFVTTLNCLNAAFNDFTTFLSLQLPEEVVQSIQF